MSNFIDKGDILRNVPKPILDKNKNYKKIENFKNLCENNRSDAISFILLKNINYYLTIVNDFHNISNDFIVGAILDSINQAIQEIDYSNSINNYVRFSGTILKRILLDEVKTSNYCKRKLDSKNVNIDSYENIDRNNVGIDEDMIVKINSPINEYEKIELIESINNSELIPIRKNILLSIVKGEGKVTVGDLSKKFDVTHQNISYHLKVLRNEHKNLLNELF